MQSHITSVRLPLMMTCHYQKKRAITGTRARPISICRHNLCCLIKAISLILSWFSLHKLYDPILSNYNILSRENLGLSLHPSLLKLARF